MIFFCFPFQTHDLPDHLVFSECIFSYFLFSIALALFGAHEAWCGVI
jgi:hypothetical protein